MSTRRKTYLINKRFQYKYIGAYLGIGLLGVLVMAVVLVHEVNRQFETQIQKVRIDISSTGEITLPIVLKLSVSFSVFILILMFVISFIHYMHARRIAGRIWDCTTRLKGGELFSGFEASEASDFGDTEAAFNGMLAAYSKKVDTLNYLTEGVENDLDAMKSAVLDERDIQPRLKNLQNKLADMDKTLSGLKTGVEEKP